MKESLTHVGFIMSDGHVINTWGIREKFPGVIVNLSSDRDNAIGEVIVTNASISYVGKYGNIVLKDKTTPRVELLQRVLEFIYGQRCDIRQTLPLF